MKRVFYLLYFFILIFFIGCKENTMKIKIYYNIPGDFPDIGRSIDFIKKGQNEYVKVYNLEEFGVNDLRLFQKYEKLEHTDLEADWVNTEKIKCMSMIAAETLFEILDQKNEVVFSYLYFEDEDYFLNVKTDKVYHMTEEIKILFNKVISKASNGNLIK